MKKMALMVALVLSIALVACGKKKEADVTDAENVENEAIDVSDAENKTDTKIDEETNKDTETQVKPDEQVSSNDSQTPDYEMIYKDVLDKTYQIISNPDTVVNDDEDDVLAILEAANYMENPLNDIGYAFIDLSKDGFSELIIGSVDKNSYTGNVILAAYTYNYGETVYSFGGPSRNPHYLTNDGKVLFYSYFGYNSYGYGLSSVNSKGTKLKCEELFYVGIGPDGETMSVFENKDGYWDEDSAYLSDMTLDEFEKKWGDYAVNTKYIELTPFEKYNK